MQFSKMEIFKFLIVVLSAISTVVSLIVMITYYFIDGYISKGVIIWFIITLIPLLPLLWDILQFMIKEKTKK